MTDALLKPVPLAKENQSPKATRDGFGEGVVLAARENPAVLAACADVTESVRLDAFKKEFPDRFVQLGVHEQFLVAFGAGLALAGKKAFVAAYATFSPGRAWEQVRTNVCLNEADVVIVGAHAGVTVGADGATHQAIEDIATMRVLPKMRVVVPCDALEARKATLAVARITGQSYLRLGREKQPIITAEETPFEIGRANVMRDGTDCAIVACGLMVGQALKAAEELATEGVSCLVINMHTVKPLDTATLLAAARLCSCVVTAEEHLVAGGLGSSVAEALAKESPAPQEFVGIQDRYGESGTAAELIEACGLGVSHVKAAVKKVVSRKKA
ncbi:MAG: transketolase C-terminal domain-containing protein [Patescibacteria group bacterium]|nr:transketolase C-terminal domain-containing protein [Patescibacteria group bacterium]